MQPPHDFQNETPDEVWPPPVPNAAADDVKPAPALPAARRALGLSLVSIAIIVLSQIIANTVHYDSGDYDANMVVGLLQYSGLLGALVSFVLGLIGWRTWQGKVACVLSATVLGGFGYVVYKVIVQD